MWPLGAGVFVVGVLLLHGSIDEGGARASASSFVAVTMPWRKKGWSWCSAGRRFRKVLVHAPPKGLGDARAHDVAAHTVGVGGP
jgi:hypothetical protein